MHLSSVKHLSLEINIHEGHYRLSADTCTPWWIMQQWQFRMILVQTMEHRNGSAQTFITHWCRMCGKTQTLTNTDESLSYVYSVMLDVESELPNTCLSCQDSSMKAQTACFWDMFKCEVQAVLMHVSLLLKLHIRIVCQLCHHHYKTLLGMILRMSNVMWIVM